MRETTALILASLLLYGVFAGSAVAGSDVVVPMWSEGDSWVVESRYVKIDRNPAVTLTPPVRWEYVVTQATRKGNEDQFEIEARSAGSSSEETLSLVYRSSGGIIELVSASCTVHRRGRIKTTKWTRDSEETPRPLSPISAIPYDLPRIKIAPEGNGMIIADWSGASTDQKVADLNDPGVAGLLDSYQSDMLAKELAKIGNTQRVTFGDSRPGPPVVQLWTKASPWPLFSASRESRSHLVEYKKRGQGQD